MKNKKLLIAGGVALGLGIIYFFWKKSKGDDSKKKIDLDETLEIDEFIDEDADLLPDLPTTRPSTVVVPIGTRPVRPLKTDPKKFMIGRMNIYISTTDVNYIWFYIQNRPSRLNVNADYLKVGNRVKLNNAGILTGTYPITKIWIDTNGNIGAVGLPIRKDKFVPVKDDRSLEGKAYFTPDEKYLAINGFQFECSDVLNDLN